MDTIQKGVLIAHILIALGIIGLVLLQRGQGANTGAAFGAGASGTVFGSRGSSSFFSRMTAILATLFFISSLTLAYLMSQRTAGDESLIQGDTAVEEVIDESLPAIEDSVDAVEEAADEMADDLPALEEEVPAEESADDLPSLEDE